MKTEVTLVAALSLLIGLVSGPAGAVTVGVTYEGPIRVRSPWVGVMRGQTDCGEEPTRVAIALTVTSTAIEDGPAVGSATIDCTSATSPMPWRIRLTGARFVIGKISRTTARLSYEIEACDRFSCVSLDGVSPTVEMVKSTSR